MALREPVVDGCIARQILLRGDVQGRGVRPTIARWATAMGVTGSVRNTADGVTVHAEGAPQDVERFLDRLAHAFPTESSPRIETATPTGSNAFEIVESDEGDSLSALVPRDRAVCSECLNEGLDSSVPRRCGYPFNSCAQCGPRYSILSAMPFDRRRTSMSGFPPCPECAEEYRDEFDRRYHAETTSCARCGPKLWMTGRLGERVAGNWSGAVRSVLLGGEIVALRGVGGYQFLCDATNAVAVRRLRRQKGRPQKPLAVLLEDLASADLVASLDHRERAALEDGRNPIVVVRARSDSPIAAGEVHPGTTDIGIMLPTTLMHRLIARNVGRPLVCTSGNREGDAIETDPDVAVARLSGIADLWVHHDRPIVRAIDDSVVRVMAGKVATIRLARGYAPLPLPLGEGTAPLLAAGGETRSSIAWHTGFQACLGPHLGDWDSLHVRERYVSHVADMESLYRFHPDVVALDAHPDYATHSLFRPHATPQVIVQHHHAHVVSALLEAEWMDREVLGVAWDGTGFGADESVWGGEFLKASATGFERVASLLPFPLPGGEAALHEPWRVALSMALRTDGVSSASLDRLFGRTRVEQVRWLLGKEMYSPRCTSAGRLFDAVGWILLGDDAVGFDGRAGMLLESIADGTEPGRLPMPWTGDSKQRYLDWRPLIRALIEQVESGTSPATIAMRFHRALAHGIIEMAELYPHLPVVLCGGVFQNRLLVELVAESWMDRNRGRLDRARLVTPGVIPVNDGGLAAGQLGIAWARLRDSQSGGNAPSCA